MVAGRSFFVWVGANLLAGAALAQAPDRDNVGSGDDYAALVLDTRGDGRVATIFRVSPRGTQADGVFNEAQFALGNNPDDLTPDFDWEARTAAAAVLQGSGGAAVVDSRRLFHDEPVHGVRRATGSFTHAHGEPVARHAGTGDDVGIIHAVAVAIERAVVHHDDAVAGVCVGAARDVENEAEVPRVSLQVVPHERVAPGGAHE